MSDTKNRDPSPDVGVNPSNPRNNSLELTFNFNSLFCCLVACLGALLSGYTIGVVNIPEASIRNCTIDSVTQSVSYWGPFPSCLPSEALEWGLMVGIMALGGGFGALSASTLCDRFGRRNAILFNNFFYLVGYLLLSTTTSKVQFGAGRFISGIGCGVASSAVSSYVGETAPIKTRGAFGTLLQLTLVVGILFSQAISLGFLFLQGWRILFAIPAVLIAAQVFLLPACVETPPYLVSRDRIEDARTSLAHLRRGYNIEEEFERILIAQGKLDNTSQGSGSTTPLQTKEMEGPKVDSEQKPFKLLFQAPHLKHFIICLLIHAIQQLSGINGVIFYSTSLFSMTFGPTSAPYITIGVAVLNLAITMLSVFLVDRFGRRALLLGSCGGMALMSILIVIGSVYVINLLVVICVLLFVAFFAIGLGPIPWMLMSEIFPTSILSIASAAAIGVNFGCNFMIGLVFPKMLASLKDYTFVFFAVVTACSFVFIYFCLPETKGKTLAEVLEEAK